jgi:integrase
MSRRSGQKGYVVKKGKMWYVRFYDDVPDREERQRRSVPVGPCKGPNKLTKPEAERKSAEMIAALGINTEEHLMAAINPAPVITFKDRVKWCRQFHKAWVEGKLGPIATMESQLTKHILPVFGDVPLDQITEEAVQEFIANLRRQTFELRRKNGTLVKTYTLSRKTILNIVGVIKNVLGRKLWMLWDLDLGKRVKPKQRSFKQEEAACIIDAAPAEHKPLFAFLFGSGVRINEAAGLHVEDLDLKNNIVYIRRTVYRGKEQSPKTENAERIIDIDPSLSDVLRRHLNGRTSGRVFEARNGSPISDGNIRNRVLQPLLKKLGIPKAGFHAYRHGRVTQLRKHGVPGDLQRQWIGHSSLRTTDIYSHTDEEADYRREGVKKVGSKLVIGPNGPKLCVETTSLSA